MNNVSLPAVANRERRLYQFGIILFLLGLLTGFLLPLMENARMGLSSHLEGIMNGVVLIVLGVIWPKLRLSHTAERITFGLAVFGTYTNWLATLAAGFIGAGASMMPIAGAGFEGSAVQEGLITLALMSLSVAMVLVAIMVLWGVWNQGNQLE
ncbi:hydrogenase [Marinobacter sp. NP-4(2019)]|uniref:hydrogenase n=1 Tax=Marinobacter sp. NP-4(2019) TaxID=2488665 RepID=UPI000FC3DF1E|nr:hydrogenase [Marinobacter sp. NP-4(2019)]AZT83618.1 hydrogenase [Marinobacter sp. NP-4(2019)]